MDQDPAQGPGALGILASDRSAPIIRDIGGNRVDPPRRVRFGRVGAERLLDGECNGARNRIRVINIAPDDIFAVSLMTRDTTATWRPLTKDGAPVPEAETQPGPAKVRIAVGETYDFEFDAPAGRSALWLDVRTSGGRWQAQAPVLVK